MSGPEERVVLHRHPDGGKWQMLSERGLSFADREYVETETFIPLSAHKQELLGLAEALEARAKKLSDPSGAWTWAQRWKGEGYREAASLLRAKAEEE